MGRQPIFALALAALAQGAAFAQTSTLSGSLADSNNSALVWSDLTAARFGTEDDIAQNVALYSMVVGTASLVTIASTGYAAGGVDPYFTLLSGAGTSATFLASNYDQVFFGSGGDFIYSGLLGAGTYQIALGTSANMSFAENLDLTLADGFIFLGETYSLRNYTYELTVSVEAGGVTPVPEPSIYLLLGLGLLPIGGWTARRASDRRATTVSAKE
jgi:hypothetical protein